MSLTVQELEGQLASARNRRERIRLLHDLGRAVVRSDPRRARDLAAESLRLSRESGDRIGEGYALLLHAASSNSLADYDTARGDIEQALVIADELGDDTIRLKARYQLAVNHARRDENAQGVGIAREIVTALEGRGEMQDLLVHTYILLGNIYARFVQQEAALEAYFRAVEICEAAGLDQELAAVYSLIGQTFDYSSDKTNGLIVLNKSLEIQKRIGDPLGEAATHGALGKHYVRHGQYEPAVTHLLEALRLVRRIGSIMIEPSMLDQLGVAYMSLEREEEALDCFDRAIEIIRTKVDGKHINFGYILYHTGMLYSKQGEYELAEKYMNEALEQAGRQGNDTLRWEICKSFFTMYERRGMFERALEYHKKFAEARFTSLDVETNARLVGMQNGFRVKMLEKEQAIRELETARLRDEMEHRNRELAVATLQLVEKSEHVRKLKEQLREIRVAGCSGIDGALKRIESELGSENDWERFARQFEHVHAGFGERLAKRHSTLTPTEVRICSLLKVQLSSKEIANLLSIEVRTVEIHRGRIRKKLGLTQKDSLGTFITAL